MWAKLWLFSYMFWYCGVVIANKVPEAGVKLLKCWKQLHLSNKDKCTLRESKKDRKKQLISREIYSFKLCKCLMKNKFVHLHIIKKTTLLLLSSSSPLCRVFILIFLRQTMSLGNTVLQLFCCYYSWCLYRYFQCWIYCTFTLVLSEVCVQGSVWLFSVVPWLHGFLLCCSRIF